MLHKLADGPLVITIVSATLTEGKFGPQFYITGTDGTEVYLSEKAATQQFGRLNLTVETAVGKTFHMEQIKKDGKTFTNIRLASATDAATPTPTAEAPAPRQKLTADEVNALYAQCVATAILTLGAKCEAAGIPFDGASIQAGAATLFIALK